LEVTFLGTGTSQGVPVIACDCHTCSSENPRDKRLRTSALLRCGEVQLVIDAGPDFRQQMLREKVRHLDAILLTHEHKDHIGGLDDVRAFNFKSRSATDIYGEERVLRILKKDYEYVFARFAYPGVPRMQLHPIQQEEFVVKGVRIQPIRVYHYRLPITAYRIGDVSYITDANYIPEESKEMLFGTKYLIINALRKEKHLSHFNLREALGIIQEISPRKAYITHIGHQMGPYEEVKRELPEHVELAWDGLSFMTE
jgi:phosphoribosyl 1,2-cyclic phosphate phosphodiesterase